MCSPRAWKVLPQSVEQPEVFEHHVATISMSKGDLQGHLNVIGNRGNKDVMGAGGRPDIERSDAAIRVQATRIGGAAPLRDVREHHCDDHH